MGHTGTADNHLAGLGEAQRRLNTTLPMARLEPVTLPDCSDMRLALINSDFPTGPLPGEVMSAVIERPAYWAFCWGSGLGLAQFLLSNPDWVAGKTVVDLGSGSGVAGIAAARAGAARVIACDTDPDARLATRVNADLNGVQLEVTATLPARCELMLMADVLYDRANLPLLETAGRHANEVLVADSRIRELPDPAYLQVTTIEAATYPNLGEFDEFGTVRVFHRPGPAV
jgi:predicted nicotinamide N-methyase